jgi:uncharacterized protein YycO
VNPSERPNFIPHFTLFHVRFALTAMAVLVCSIDVFAQSKKQSAPAYQPREGDILFQALPNPPGLDLVDTIEGSTGSSYSHCGMVCFKGQAWKVIEAIGPVQETPLEEWIARGRDKQVWAYRLREKERPHIPAMLDAMRKDLGKPYDIHYRFDDQAIYCSELIWRGWKSATGRELGKAVKLGDLNWRPYQRVIEAIEGAGNLPLDREMITPRDLAAAPELERVFPEH